MAAPDMNVNRAGQINGSGAVDALFLKKFMGEVLTAFEEKNIMRERHMVRPMSGAKVAQFPAIGRASARYHVPGTYITGTKIDNAEVTITVDDLLISDVSVPYVDDLVAHYEYRSHYTTALGRALARQMDKHLLQLGCLAAGTTNVLNDEPDGEEIYTNDSDLTGTPDFTNAEDFIEAAYLMAARFDEKDVPEDGRFVVVPPSFYYKLVQNDKVLSSDFNNSNGDFARANVFRVADFEIVKSNHLPNTDLSSATDVSVGPLAKDGDYYTSTGAGNYKYEGDFSDVTALFMTPEALGTIMYKDLAVETTGFDVRTQSQLFVAKYLLGHGIVNPPCAGVLKNTTLV